MNRRGMLVLASLLAISLPAFGQAGQGDGSQTGDGSTPFTGLSQAPEANLFLGAAQLSVPIEVPPGRKLTPKLSLQYSSNAGPSPYGYGWDFGLPRIQRSSKNGARTCAPDRNEFVLNLAGGTVECTLQGNDCIPRVQEAFIRIRATEQWVGGSPRLTWDVWDKSGVHYVFGGSAAAVAGGTHITTAAPPGDDVYIPLSCGYGATWELTSIDDPNGNKVFVRWLLEQGVIYPYAIRYGDTSWETDKFEVAFAWEGRDDDLINGTGGIEATLTKRLARINVRYNGGQVRAYTFHYTPGRSGRQTFLEEVRLRGSDDSLLARADGAAASSIFSYHSKVAGFAATAQTPQRPPVDAGQPTVMRWTQLQDTLSTTLRDVFDINGDGFPDLIDATACPWAVYKGSRTGFAATSTSWYVPPGVPCSIRRVVSASPTSMLWTTMDLTGDGLPDFIDARVTPWLVYPGTAHSASGGWGFGAAITWDGMPSNARPQVIVDHQIGNPGSDNNWIGTATRHDLLDMTGDGRPDLVVGEGGDDGGGSSILDPLAPATWTVYPNTGTGFGSPYAFDAPFKNTSFTSANGTTYNGLVYGTFDVNGDGLADGVISQRARNSTYTGFWRVCLNSGRAMDACDNWAVPNNFGSATSRWIRATANGQPSDILRDFMDINGDGLPDLVDTAGWNTSGNWNVFLNRGDALEQSPLPSWPAPFGRLRDVGSGSRFTYIDTFDINGDGMADQVDFTQNPYRIYHAADGAWAANGAGIVDQESGMRANLLVTSENGVGGTTFLHYRPSSQWDNTGGDGIGDLPFVVWTVTEIVRDDGLCYGTSCTNPGSAHQTGTSYSYVGGRYDPLTRAFRGFSVVDAQEQADASVPRRGTVTIFSQSAAKAGKSQLSATYDARGNIYTMPIVATFNTWECVNPSSGAAITCPAVPAGDVWVRLKSVVERAYSNYNTNDYKELTTDNVSWHQCGANNYGNVAQVTRGATGGPVLRTTTEYACEGADTPYIVDRPVHVLVSGTASNPLEEKWYYYDNQVDSGGKPKLGKLTRGNATQIETWLSQSSVDSGATCTGTPAAGTGGCVYTKTGYDSSTGNIISVTDALSRVTTTT
jgi:hypothetical protein